VTLGPEYKGARVSRAALEDSSEGEEEESEEEGEEEEDEEEGDEDDLEDGSEEYDDPDEVDLEADQDFDDDAEIDSDNALGESDVERFKDFVFRGSSKPRVPKGEPSRSRRPKASDFISSSEDDKSDDDEEPETLRNGVNPSEEDDDGDEDDISGTSEDMDDDEGEGDESDDEQDDAQRAELRKMMNEGQKNVVATISQAAKADAEKGRAVRQQRRGFDSLLNIRIRLQKALVATNSFNMVENDVPEPKESYDAAEEAIINLWSSIDDFRQSLLSESNAARVGEKRKRDVSIDSSSQTIWDSMLEMEEPTLTHRRKVLEKWSTRVKSTVAAVTTRRLGPSTSQSLTSTLDDQLLSTDRLVRRSQIPRSCAPLQTAKKIDEDPEIYDDADFYQLLLKELVDQRTTDSSTAGGQSGTATVRWAALKEAKTRKQVDRKASKGRKLRYEVHEKLQNFMTTEDRRTWEQEAIDRFFGTLFGKKMDLEEDHVQGSDDEDVDMGGARVQDMSLRLFSG
jgi:protein AATF/BFR2